MQERRRWIPLVSLGLMLLSLLASGGAGLLRRPAAAPALAAPVLDLSPSNRRAPIAGLPDWSRAGYRGGQSLPGSGALNPDAACQITPAELAAAPYNVRPGDGVDDSAGLQQAIDTIKAQCSPSAGFSRLSLITLPAGTINVSRQIYADASYLIIRGAGADPLSGTRLVFRPDLNTRYDTFDAELTRWDQDSMVSGSAKGGWIWPGRGLFRVQTRAVHGSYSSEYSSAAANRKDLFEGTVNVHWKAGLKLRARPGDSQPFAARRGERTIYLDSSTSSTLMASLQPGRLLEVRAANSIKFYQDTGVTNTSYYENIHARMQVFTISSVDAANKTVTIDQPLEFDLPVDSTSDGSSPILGTAYPSKVVPLAAVEGVGFEDFYLTQELAGMPRHPALGGGSYSATPQDVRHNYGNAAPDYAMHGIVFKWAANSYVRGIRTSMTGSHPIVTEVAKNIQLQDNYLDGSWNKGKGGNGYLRGSRVWDSLYAGNTSRNLRHFTLQWSSSKNVVIGNDFDSDLNLHGGWERHNLFELNTVTVPYNHSSGSCTASCGGEGDGVDDGTWYPIWWGAGAKAAKWSSASGPQNVFFNNVLRKQLVAGGPFLDYAPYYASDGSRSHVIFQLGWDRATTSGSGYEHLKLNGALLADWAGSETVSFAAAPNAGVNALRSDPGQSLFLLSVGGSVPPTATSTAVGATVTATSTRTSTPPPRTATRTATRTSTASGATPTRTTTRTSTAVATTATRTATRTSTTSGATATRTATHTSTAVVATATSSPAGGLRAQYRAGDAYPTDGHIRPHLQVVNGGSASVALSELRLRYWYSWEGSSQAQQYVCDYAIRGCGNIAGSFVKLATPRSGADHYLELSFTSGAGSLAAGQSSGEIKSRFNKSDWSSYSEVGDYSYDPGKTAFADWERLTLYRNGALVWGAEP